MNNIIGYSEDVKERMTVWRTLIAVKECLKHETDARVKKQEKEIYDFWLEKYLNKKSPN